MQALAWLASPALPELTAQFQPDAVLWMAQPAYGAGNATWAVHHLIANFSGGPPPRPTGAGPPPVPSRLELVTTTMWCAPSFAAGKPLIAEAEENGLGKLPLVSIGAGPQAAGAQEAGAAAGGGDGGGGQGGSGRSVPAWVIAVPIAAVIGAGLACIMRGHLACVP